MTVLYCKIQRRVKLFCLTEYLRETGAYVLIFRFLRRNERKKARPPPFYLGTFGSFWPFPQTLRNLPEFCKMLRSKSFIKRATPFTKRKIIFDSAKKIQRKFTRICSTLICYCKIFHQSECAKQGWHNFIRQFLLIVMGPV